MPDTTNIEVLEGKEPAPSTGSRTLPSTPTPARQEAEAGGHYLTVRVMRCWSCGALSYVEYDPNNPQEYHCSHCNVSNNL